MATLQLEQNTMKNSTEYLPILRSVLKSQIQFLVEQLSDAGEETFILSANVKDGAVEQLGSESGKLFANVYDDFKSEFLGFCQRRQGKRKLESPQKTPVDAKRGKAAPAVMAVKSPQNVPKVSSARVIMSHKQASSATSTAGNQGIQPSDQPGIVELGESGEDYSEVEDTGLGYEELQDVQTWEGEEQSQDTSTISQVTPSGSKGTSTSVQKKIVSTIQNPNMIITSAGSMKTIKFEKSLLIKNTCIYCNKVFGSERDMKLHMRSHTGEKPYKCEVCEQLFTLKRSLEKHMLKQHVSVTTLNVKQQNV